MFEPAISLFLIQARQFRDHLLRLLVCPVIAFEMKPQSLDCSGKSVLSDLVLGYFR